MKLTLFLARRVFESGAGTTQALYADEPWSGISDNCPWTMQVGAYELAIRTARERRSGIFDAMEFDVLR